MGYRWLFWFITLVMLFPLYSLIAAAPDAPTLDELSWLFGFMFEAKAEQQLSATEWLFSEVHMLNDCTYCRDQMPEHVVGWWSLPPREVRQIVCPPAPEPKNTSLLKAGGRFLLIVGRDLHLRSVYPVSAEPGKYLGEWSFWGSLELAACAAPKIRKTAETLQQALMQKDWGAAEKSLAEPIRAELRAAGSPQMYFEKTGLLHLALPEKGLPPVPFHIRVWSLGAKSAEVLAWGDRGNRMLVLTMKLESTRGKGGGAYVWEISAIKQIKDEVQ